MRVTTFRREAATVRRLLRELPKIDTLLAQLPNGKLPYTGDDLSGLRKELERAIRSLARAQDEAYTPLADHLRQTLHGPLDSESVAATSDKHPDFEG